MRKYLCDECKDLPEPRKAHECPGCRSLKAAAWFQRNKDKVRAWTLDWRARNPLRWKQIRASERRDPAKRAASRAAWQRNNLDKHYAKQVRYRLRNKKKHLDGRRKLYLKQTYGEFADAQAALRTLTREIRGQYGER
jgi:hypothetical protein